MDLDWLLLPHSVALSSPDNILVEAGPKISAYVDYRVSRMNELLSCFTNSSDTAAAASSQSQERSRQQLFDTLYGPKNLAANVKIAAYMNLDLQTDKLCEDGLLRFDEDKDVYVRTGAGQFKL